MSANTNDIFILQCKARKCLCFELAACTNIMSLIMIKNDEDEAIYILQHTLDEQRRFHDEITSSFESIKSKIVLYIGALLAVLTFLYSGALDDKKSMQARLFIPTELYGMLFYFFGLLCVGYALFILIRSMRKVAQWEVFSDTADGRIVGGLDKKLGKKEYLQSMVDGYDKATNNNLTEHKNKYDAIKNAFSPMIGGAIILVVLRFFQ